MGRRIGWGIVGTGGMAARFAAALRSLEGAEVAAVASRTEARAAAFGEAHAVPRRHASVEALARDPAVDVCYVATPHALHLPHARACLEGGKPVLCEKPLALSAREGRALASLARERGLLLAEGMWTRLLPAVRAALDLVRAGAIGAPRLVTADFGFHEEPGGAGGNLYDLSLGGGALLDVGCYPVALARWVLGRPSSVAARAHLGHGGVDEVTAVTLAHEGGALAQVLAAIRLETPQEAVIAGSAGLLRLRAPWWRATRLTLARPGAAEETREHPIDGEGHALEAAEVARCLARGLRESPLLPLDDSIGVLETLDAARAAIGLRYPGE